MQNVGPFVVRFFSITDHFVIYLEKFCLRAGPNNVVLSNDFSGAPPFVVYWHLDCIVVTKRRKYIYVYFALGNNFFLQHFIEEDRGGTGDNCSEFDLAARKNGA